MPNSEARKRILRGNLSESMKNHHIEGKGLVGFGLPVILLSSDNEYLAPGVRGVMKIIEQGTDLRVIVAVFHRLTEDHNLGAPVECRNPVFVYSPIHA